MMQNDELFRLILILGLLIVLPIGLYHRIKSQQSGERLDRRQEGFFILATLRPIAFLRMMGLITWLIEPRWMSWSSIFLPTFMRWIGVGLGLVTMCLLVWVFRSLGTNLTDTVVTRQEHKLVTTGPYRWVRHPFYVAFALAILSDSLVTSNGFLAVTGTMTFLLILIRTKREEEHLIKRFGDDYLLYMHSTGKFIPRLNR